MAPAVLMGTLGAWTWVCDVRHSVSAWSILSLIQNPLTAALKIRGTVHPSPINVEKPDGGLGMWFSKCKAASSNPSTTKKTKQKQTPGVVEGQQWY
jgi:hypothetical protein